jgi:AcrR family transcriptional regulator
MARQAERSARTIRLILDTSQLLFAEHGYDGVSVEEIAHEAGLTKGALYHHFASKRAIFDALVDQLQGQIAEQLSQAPTDKRPKLPVEGLAHGAAAYLQAANDPAMRRILLIDGPVVLGRERWREIDNRHFGKRVRDALAMVMRADEATLEAATGVVMSAIMEGALASGAAATPATVIQRYAGLIAKVSRGLADNVSSD